jgi:hypothetical protein
MEYQIALPPELGLRPAEFVAAWNATPQARALAQARVDSDAAHSYDPLLMAGVIALGLAVASNIAASALYDLIKEVLLKQGVRKRTTIVERTRPDGTHLLIVTIEEE